MPGNLAPGVRGSLYWRISKMGALRLNLIDSHLRATHGMVLPG